MSTERATFNVYGRLVIEVEKREASWLAYRVSDGKRRREFDVVIPDGLTLQEVKSFIDDIFHEFARPGETIRILEQSSGLNAKKEMTRMYTFFSFSAFTDNGLKSLRGWRGADSLRSTLKKHDIELKHYLWSPFAGPFDILVVSKAKSIEHMAESKKAMIGLSAVNTDTFLVSPTVEHEIDEKQPIYLSIGRRTDQGMQSISNPSGQIAQEIKTLEQDLTARSVRLCGVYWVLAGSGADVIVLTQSPHSEAIAESHLQTAVHGKLRTQIHVLYPEKALATACGKLGQQAN